LDPTTYIFIYTDFSAEQTQAYSVQNDKNLLIPLVEVKMNNPFGKTETAIFFENFIRQNDSNVHSKDC
jgi:hypothetical protein